MPRSCSRSDGDRSAHLWDAASSRPLGQPLSHLGEIDGGSFLPGRPAVATVSRDGTARLWAVPAPLPGDPVRVVDEVSVLTGMELRDDDVVRALDVSAWKSKHEAIGQKQYAGP